MLLALLENLATSMLMYCLGFSINNITTGIKENRSLFNESAVFHKYPDGTYLSVAGGSPSNHSF